ncbi:type II toxin-antitoxin system mRNA interferase toxin, RelE/StbE family [Candidatus Uhrbacteria bacterium]|nr:type II toxin-antitoxin system mRNA interferase toxin, RelE/StbE family [Candidatus Uhrbacteria bacterium]
MTISYGIRFLKSVRTLPNVQQKKLATLLELFQNNPYHPLLHAKPLTGELAGFYSFRITRDWRVIFRFDSPIEMVLVEVGNRKDIYR